MVLTVGRVQVGIEHPRRELNLLCGVIDCLCAPLRPRRRSEESDVIASQRIRIRIDSIIHVVREYRKGCECIRRSQASTEQSQVSIQESLLQVHLSQVISWGVNRVHRKKRTQRGAQVASGAPGASDVHRHSTYLDELLEIDIEPSYQLTCISPYLMRPPIAFVCKRSRVRQRRRDAKLSQLGAKSGPIVRQGLVPIEVLVLATHMAPMRIGSVRAVHSSGFCGRVGSLRRLGGRRRSLRRGIGRRFVRRPLCGDISCANSQPECPHRCGENNAYRNSRRGPTHPEAPAYFTPRIPATRPCLRPGATRYGSGRTTIPDYWRRTPP